MYSGKFYDPKKLPIVRSQELEGHTGYINCVKFSNDDNYCMTGGQDGTVILWNPFKGKLVKNFKGIHNREIQDIAITKDNNKVASCGADRPVFYWDVQTNQTIKIFSGHNARVNTCCFNDDENVIVSGSYDGTMRIFDIKQYKPVELDCCKHFGDSVTCILVSEWHIFAGCVDGRIRHFDIRSGEVTSDYVGEPIVAMDLTTDKKSLLLSTTGNKIFQFNIVFGESLNTYQGHILKNYSINVKLSKDNSFFATGSEDGYVYYYTLLENTPKFSAKAHNGVISCQDICKKDNSMVTCSHDGKVVLWKAQ